jgi:hypothetical protein
MAKFGVARRSETGFARLSEGGCGTPGVPQPVHMKIENAGHSHSHLARSARINQASVAESAIVPLLRNGRANTKDTRATT